MASSRSAVGPRSPRSSGTHYALALQDQSADDPAANRRLVCVQPSPTSGSAAALSLEMATLAVEHRAHGGPRTMRQMCTLSFGRPLRRDSARARNATKSHAPESTMSRRVLSRRFRTTAETERASKRGTIDASDRMASRHPPKLGKHPQACAASIRQPANNCESHGKGKSVIPQTQHMTRKHT